MRTLLVSTVLLALLATVQVAAAQTGTAPFCLKTSTGPLRCTFATMGECEQARSSSSSAQCVTRSDAGGTTGLGDGPAPSPPGSPSEPRAPER
jgi:hypothetical protein